MNNRVAVVVRIVGLAVALLVCPVAALAEPPPRPLANFGKAAGIARDVIYSGHNIDFYCGCAYTPNNKGTSGRIHADSCGYEPRKSAKRGGILELEHVMPAHAFGSQRVCWKKGHAKCVTNRGVSYKGRKCCAKVDAAFKKMEADLHNLTPAVGELNGDRSNLPYGVVKEDLQEYGACEFKIGGKPRVTEPRDEVKGDAARIWLYMVETYKINVPSKQLAMFNEWSKQDPVDQWERLRDKRIAAAQGNRNPYLK